MLQKDFFVFMLMIVFTVICSIAWWTLNINEEILYFASDHIRKQYYKSEAICSLLSIPTTTITEFIFVHLLIKARVTELTENKRERQREYLFAIEPIEKVFSKQLRVCIHLRARSPSNRRNVDLSEFINNAADSSQQCFPWRSRNSRSSPYISVCPVVYNLISGSTAPAAASIFVVHKQSPCFKGK